LIGFVTVFDPKPEDEPMDMSSVLQRGLRDCQFGTQTESEVLLGVEGLAKKSIESAPFFNQMMNRYCSSYSSCRRYICVRHWGRRWWTRMHPNFEIGQKVNIILLVYICVDRACMWRKTTLKKILAGRTKRLLLVAIFKLFRFESYWEQTTEITPFFMWMVTKDHMWMHGYSRMNEWGLQHAIHLSREYGCWLLSILAVLFLQEYCTQCENAATQNSCMSGSGAMYHLPFFICFMEQSWPRIMYLNLKRGS
jgi:hypothetical protein